MQRQGSAGPPWGVRWLGLGVSAFVCQIGLIYGLATLPGATQWLPILLPTAHLLLIPFLVRNLSFWGMRLVLVGLSLNLTAMLLNGGLMPIEPSTVEAVGRVNLSDIQPGSHLPGTKNRLLTSGDARVALLRDQFPILGPGPFRAAISIGDILVAGGVLAAFGEVMMRRSPDGRSDG